MFCNRFVNSICRGIVFVAAAIFGSSHATAEVLTTATWDTDSYVYFGTSNPAATEITLGEPTPPGVDPHFNIGFMTFDVSGLAASGLKFLEVEPNTATAVLPSTMRLAPLAQDTSGYFAETTAAGRAAWLAANVLAQPPAATLHVSPGGGKHFADITAVVDGWIADPSSNYGLALWRVGGDGFDSPEFFSADDPMGRGPALNSVPEPGTIALALGGALVFAAASWRRRVQVRRSLERPRTIGS